MMGNYKQQCEHYVQQLKSSIQQDEELIAFNKRLMELTAKENKLKEQAIALYKEQIAETEKVIESL